MAWFQKTITVKAPSRGCHLITDQIMKAVGKEIGRYQIGLATLFIQPVIEIERALLQYCYSTTARILILAQCPAIYDRHTSASLTINENCDPDVRVDMEGALNRIVPESWNNEFFKHTMEGPDDMPAHVKTTLIGPTVTVPITSGSFNLGTWQGIYLCEHRNTGGWGGGHTRKIVVTLQGALTAAAQAAAAQGGGGAAGGKKR